MRSDESPKRGRWTMVGIAALAGCTLWLVVQNVILLAWLTTSSPGSLGHVAAALAKVGGLLIARIWPAWISLVAAILPLMIFLAGRGAKPVPHGGA